MSGSYRSPDSVELSRARQMSRPSRLLIALAIFGMAGPPIGGLVAWLTMGARSMNSPLPFLAGAYAEAAALAIGVGLLVAIASLTGRSSALVPLAAALVVDVAMFVATGALRFSSFDPGTLLRVAYVFVPPSIVAAMTCWLLTRKLLAP